MITLFTQEKYSRFEFPSKREKGYSFKTKHKVNSDYARAYAGNGWQLTLSIKMGSFARGKNN